MYVIVVIAVLLIGVLFQLIRTSRAEKRKEQEQAVAAARLKARLDQAAREYQERVAAAEASDALTSVIPTIKIYDHAPRKVS